eukprot:24413-Amphidinium_carterae.1
MDKRMSWPTKVQVRMALSNQTLTGFVGLTLLTRSSSSNEVPGRTGTHEIAYEVPGGTVSHDVAEPGRTGHLFLASPGAGSTGVNNATLPGAPAARNYWPIFRHVQRGPDKKRHRSCLEKSFVVCSGNR